MTFQVRQKTVGELSLPQAQDKLVAVTEYPTKTPLVDKAFSLIALICVSPLLLLLALSIFIGGQSPIFVQERIGLYFFAIPVF